MKTTLILESVADLSLDNARLVAKGDVRLELSPQLRDRVAHGRARFEQYIANQKEYVYGTNTAPGNRAKVQLATEDQEKQGRTLLSFITSRPGLGTGRLPDRAVRLALLCRLSNALTGSGKLSLPTVDAICELLNTSVPEVPLDGMIGPGEVMPLSWLLAPIADRPLATGEAMALVNGSPFASAMVTDVALTARRQMDLAFHVFALSAEAALMPHGHFLPALAERWPDAFYAKALAELHRLLEGGATDRLSFQAPVAWRIVPNVAGVALRAVDDAEQCAAVALRSLKDNPTFIPDSNDPARDQIVSSGGYNDHRSGRAIDTINAAWSDLCALAYRQVARLVGGTDVGLPHLLSSIGADGVGSEYIAWTLTGSLERVRQAAVPAGLIVSLEDPGGNQSDLCEPVSIAYSRHLAAARSLNECLGALCLSALIALRLRSLSVPSGLKGFVDQISPEIDGVTASDAAGQPLRRIVARFDQHILDESPSVATLLSDTGTTK